MTVAETINVKLNVARNLLSAIFACVLLCLMHNEANAQTVTNYSNIPATPIAIADNDCSVAASVTRTFFVGANYTVADVDLGVLISHTYRSDIRIYLTSPSNTTANILTWSGNVQSGDNYNDLFDDEAPSAITTHNASVTDSTASPGSIYPYYSHAYKPSNPLSVFDGQNAFGTWTMTICDAVGADTGSFVRADLFITETPTNYADLSLTKTVSNASPAFGATISYTLAVTNASGSPQTANSVSVRDVLPAGFTFSSSSGFGSYSSGTGIWTVGSIPPGITRTLTITGTVAATSGATITNEAEVIASSVPDIDSTPNNGANGEDDYAARNITVSGTRTAGTPPILTCAAGTSVFDWDTVSWASGNIMGNYPVANIGTINFNLANPGAWQNLATYGGQSPSRQNVVNGGNTGQFSLFEFTDMANQSQEATTTITLPTAVPGAQFTIFDVDYAAGQFADRITVTGSFNGSPVTPVLTNNTANYVIGNSAFGDQTSADTDLFGNVVVTFTSPVDTIIIAYGNHSLAPANPGQQAIALHDITFCRPTATLSVTKISNVVSDGISATNPKSIPGATVRYCILVTNAGSATATNVTATDPVPATVTVVPTSLLVGANCASAAAPASPYSISLSGTTVTGVASSLAPSGSMAMVFNAMIN